MMDDINRTRPRVPCFLLNIVIIQNQQCLFSYKIKILEVNDFNPNEIAVSIALLLSFLVVIVSNAANGGVARVISFGSPSPDLQYGRRRFIMAYNDWEWRIGNKKEQKKQRLEQNRVGNKAWRVIDDITTKFYVTNFPPGTYPNDLRTLCEKFGRVVDVYIHPKLSKYGKKFAFVKFLNIHSDRERDDMVVKLRSIWIGSYHVFASVARFARRDGLKEDTVRRGIVNNRASQNTAHKEKEQVRNVPRGSYAEAVREGEGISVKEVKAKGQSRSIELPMNCIVSIMEQPLHRLVALNGPTVKELIEWEVEILKVDDDSVDDDGGSEGMSERESECEDQNYDNEQEVEEVRWLAWVGKATFGDGIQFLNI
ncbi:hypothetical protein LXL04_003743 [Taraxacum kok-saghyz]